MCSESPALQFVIVEDIPDVADRLRYEMQAFPTWHFAGHAISVKEATRLIETHKPQLLFCDWDLVGGSGFEVLQYAQSVPNYHPFIIFNTGFQSDHPEIAEDLVNHYRPDAFVNKPYWQKLKAQLPTLVQEAAAKAAGLSGHSTKKYWLTTIEKARVPIAPAQLICVVQSVANPRQKVFYTTDHQQGVQTYYTWQEVLLHLDHWQVDYFITNKRHSLVCKPYVIKADKLYVHLQHLPFKVDLVKEHIREFYDWLEAGNP